MAESSNQHSIHLPAIDALATLGICSISSISKNLLDLSFPPLLLALLDSIDDLLDLHFLVSLLVRLAVPAQLEFGTGGFFEAAFDEGILFEGLEDVDVGGEVGGAQGLDGEFENDDGEED